MNKLFVFVTLSFLFARIAFSQVAGNIAYRNSDKYLNSIGITKDFTPESYQNLKQFLDEKMVLIQNGKFHESDEIEAFRKSEWVSHCKHSIDDSIVDTIQDSKEYCEEKYNPEHDKKWLKQVKQFYQYAQTILNEADKELDTNEMAQAYLWAKRIVYSVLSEYYSERTGNIFETLEVVPRVMRI